jgi:CDGSH-type Zn-finger protein
MEKRKVKLISPQEGHVGLVAQKVGRNDFCRCGSGLKAKRCCGNTTAYFNREKSSAAINAALDKELLNGKNHH